MSLELHKRKSQPTIDLFINPHLTLFDIKSRLMSERTPFRVWLLAEMDKQGISKQAELARRSGAHLQSINRILNDTPHTQSGGKPSVTEAMAEKLAKGLGLPLDTVRIAAGYAPSGNDPILQAMIDAAGAAPKNDGYTPEEIADFKDEMEYQIRKKIERIIEKRTQGK